MEVFARFAPAYFEYMADALFGTVRCARCKPAAVITDQSP